MPEGDALKSFSNDLLKIEMSGPDHDHFSVIDLPGLFRKPTPGQTTKEDMLLVRNIVSSHLNNKRSFILAVVPANVDIATQEIIQMAEDADPERKRTLAVLTKPDLVDQGAEDHIIDLVNWASSGPGQGYVVVCNRSQRDLDIPLSERHANERAFLSQPPWDEVSPDRAGVEPLRRRLNNLAIAASRQSFEEVSLEIIRKLNNAGTRLEMLGSPRHTAEAQRLFLLQMASEYQSLIYKATDAHYGRDECFRRQSSLRLATGIMDESEKFSITVAKRGAYRIFNARQISDSDTEIEEEAIPNSAERASTALEGERHGDDQEIARDFPDLSPFLKVNQPEPVQSDEPVSKWITRKYHEFRGFEVGGLSPSLITALVHEQTNSWGYYALNYVGNVVKRIHRCIHDLLQQICLDHQVHGRLWSHLVPKLKDKYEVAIKHTQFLIDVERNGYPITLNHYLAQTMTKRRRGRIEGRLRRMKAWHTTDDARQYHIEDVGTTLAIDSFEGVCQHVARAHGRGTTTRGVALPA